MAERETNNADAPRRRRERASRDLAIFLGALVAVQGALIMLAMRTGTWAAFGICGTIFIASATIGAFLGFLFAVPRVLARGTEVEAAAKDKGTETAPSEDGSNKQGRLRARMLETNTNLERISDWLTTMLVGVGLSQIGNLNSGLRAFSESLAQRATVFQGPSGWPASAGMIPTIGPLLLMVGVVVGFFLAYLMTRLILAPLFNDVERDLGPQPMDPGRALLKDEGTKEAVKSAASLLDANIENPALKTISVAATPSVDQSIAVMFNLLYRPNGYQEVIDLGGKLSNTPAVKKADYWFLLAAAFGQKHKELVKAKAADNDTMSARDNALDCAQRAVEIDPTYRARLWAISKPGALDDDLSDFRNDPKFRAIVGIPMNAETT
jgi:hypothetical protein